jgi:hypothetical protein
MNEEQLEALDKARAILSPHFGSWVIALEWRVEDKDKNWRMGYRTAWAGSSATALGILNLAESHIKNPDPTPPASVP